MRVDLLTREYPPHIYGGAGVHVTELARVLRRHIEVQVHCFDGPRQEAGVTGYDVPDSLTGANAALGTLGVDLQMAGAVGGADLVHTHTWYANLGGHLGGLLHGIPHVLSAHSLEPLRPWKADQLGGGYALSSWAERTAYEGAARVIAVSAGMR
ncbi:MAG TPA: glycosyltransferase, partial [Beutenbergiaceae bacterium]|nr:glycosyltransferase [Beutenbergiaceae bacterium]